MSRGVASRRGPAPNRARGVREQGRETAGAIGIDLGTTNSAMAVLEGGEPVIIPNAEGERTTPSMVAVTASGERLVGTVAKRQAVTNPDNTIFSVKRLMGGRVEAREVKNLRAIAPFDVNAADNGDARVRLGDRDYSPPELSAMILQKLKADAEAYLGQPVEAAVITVPAYFDDAQRQATRDAGRIAGLDVKRIINEPTAASLAYGMETEHEEIIAVYDLGGGTFDISILAIEDGTFQVLSTSGDTFLGGDDFDNALINYLVHGFRGEEGIDLRTDHAAMQRIKEGVEQVKIELSSAQQSLLNLPFISTGGREPKHMQFTITRERLERLSEDLVERTIGPVRDALAAADLQASDVDQVLLVGGMTRMPLVREKVREFFGKEPHQGVNPDEVVAIGAAIQAGVLGGAVKDLVLLDVTPITLGTDLVGDRYDPLIPRNTTIPTVARETYTTVVDNQPRVAVEVLQGESPKASENKQLARFTLDGIQRARQGVPKLEVEFRLDADGILKVSARDKVTGVQQHVIVEPSSGLSEREVQRMVTEAAEYAERDRARQEGAEVRNEADSLARSAERALDELDPGLRRRVESVLADLRDGIEDERTRSAWLRERMDALSRLLREADEAPRLEAPR